MKETMENIRKKKTVLRRIYESYGMIGRDGWGQGFGGGFGTGYSVGYGFNLSGYYYCGIEENSDQNVD